MSELNFPSQPPVVSPAPETVRDGKIDSCFGGARRSSNLIRDEEGASCESIAFVVSCVGDSHR